MVLSVQLHTFVCGYPILPAPFVEKIALSPLNSLGILAKSYLTLNSTSYSWTLSYSIGLYVCLCINTTLGFLFLFLFFFSFCINYHTVLMTDFVVSLEIRKCEFFSFILFLRLFWLFRVPWDLRMGFSISTKTIIGILKGTASNTSNSDSSTTEVICSSIALWLQFISSRKARLPPGTRVELDHGPLNSSQRRGLNFGDPWRDIFGSSEPSVAFRGGCFWGDTSGIRDSRVGLWSLFSEHPSEAGFIPIRDGV